MVNAGIGSGSLIGTLVVGALFLLSVCSGCLPQNSSGSRQSPTSGYILIQPVAAGVRVSAIAEERGTEGVPAVTMDRITVSRKAERVAKLISGNSLTNGTNEAVIEVYDLDGNMLKASALPGRGRTWSLLTYSPGGEYIIALSPDSGRDLNLPAENCVVIGPEGSTYGKAKIYVPSRPIVLWHPLNEAVLIGTESDQHWTKPKLLRFPSMEAVSDINIDPGYHPIAWLEKDQIIVYKFSSNKLLLKTTRLSGELIGGVVELQLPEGTTGVFSTSIGPDGLVLFSLAVGTSLAENLQFMIYDTRNGLSTNLPHRGISPRAIVLRGN